MLDDGTYDAFVVDATIDDDGLLLELAIVAGPHKGEMVAVRRSAPDDGGDPVLLLGLPGTLEVVGGQPTVTLEP